MKLEESTITALLLGELSPKEEQAVRKAIAEDEHWQDVVRDYEKLLTGFREERVNKYAAEVADAPTPPSMPPKAGRPWLWLLSLAAIVVTGFFLWPTGASSEELAQAYFILPGDPTVAGQNDVTPIYQDGLAAFFRERNYSAAVEAFTVVQEDSTWGRRAQFYIGHAYFMVDDYPKAEQFLEQSLSQTDDFSRFERQDLAWNVLMARLAQGEDIQTELSALPDREEKEELLQKLVE